MPQSKSILNTEITPDLLTNDPAVYIGVYIELTGHMLRSAYLGEKETEQLARAQLEKVQACLPDIDLKALSDEQIALTQVLNSELHAEHRRERI